MRRHLPCFTPILLLLSLFCGCAKKGPSDEAEKALSLIESNMTGDAVSLLESRVKAEPTDTSAMFLLKVLRADASAAELMKLSETDSWAKGHLMASVRASIAAQVPSNSSFKPFTEDAIEGDVGEADSYQPQTSLTGLLAPYAMELREWYLTSSPDAFRDPKSRFVVFMRLGHGPTDPQEKLEMYAKGQKGAYLNLAKWGDRHPDLPRRAAR